MHVCCIESDKLAYLITLMFAACHVCNKLLTYLLIYLLTYLFTYLLTYLLLLLLLHWPHTLKTPQNEYSLRKDKQWGVHLIGLSWLILMYGYPSTTKLVKLMATVKFICDQQSFAVNWPWNRLAVTSTTVTGPVGQRLQTGTEDAPVLDRPAPLRRVHYSGAGYKYPDTYLLTDHMQ